MIGIVVSRADEASTTIGDQLRTVADWTTHDDPSRPDASGGGLVDVRPGFELREFDDLHLSLEGAAAAFSTAPDPLVFVSKHAGETDPMVTAHFTGNFGPAEHGGSPRELATAAPVACRQVLEALRTRAPSGFAVGLECTHHGPTDAAVPSLFVEVGSSAAEWTDPRPAAAAARAVLAIDPTRPSTDRVVVGLGGGHYAPRFDRILRETDWAVGHIAADWSLSAMGEPDPAVLAQAFERSGASRAVLDGDHPAVAETVDALGFDVVSETWVRETSGVPLATVGAVESALGRIADGVRFGDRTSSADFVLYEPDPGLLADAHGIDREAAVAAIDRHAVAYETVEAGTQVAGRIALLDESAVDGLVAELGGVLERRFDRVDRRGDELIARRTVFDPERARALGVPEGPAFGRLADGDPVETDEGLVEPEAVHTVRTRRFRV